MHRDRRNEHFENIPRILRGKVGSEKGHCNTISSKWHRLVDVVSKVAIFFKEVRNCISLEPHWTASFATFCRNLVETPLFHPTFYHESLVGFQNVHFFRWHCSFSLSIFFDCLHLLYMWMCARLDMTNSCFRYLKLLLLVLIWDAFI